VRRRSDDPWTTTPPPPDFPNVLCQLPPSLAVGGQGADRTRYRIVALAHGERGAVQKSNAGGRRARRSRRGLVLPIVELLLGGCGSAGRRPSRSASLFPARARLAYTTTSALPTGSGATGRGRGARHGAARPRLGTSVLRPRQRARCRQGATL
jgi:hypothetical protein